MPIARNDTAKTRAVLDTNVLISALVAPRGVPWRVVTAAIEEKFILISSSPLLKELAGVLRRPAFTRRPGKRATRDFLALVSKEATLAQPTERIHAVAADPSDNAVLEAAVSGWAEAIVTGDHKHLLPLEDFRGIPIMTPREFLELLDAQTSR